MALPVNQLPPYAQFLGIRTEQADGAPLYIMPFGDVVLGRPGYLHGGAIAGLLEFAAFGALRDALADDTIEAKPVNITVQFMRGGIDHDTYATAVVARLGKRVANVEAHAWQRDRTKPIAAAQMNLLLRRP